MRWFYEQNKPTTLSSLSQTKATPVTRSPPYYKFRKGSTNNLQTIQGIQFNASAERIIEIERPRTRYVVTVNVSQRTMPAIRRDTPRRHRGGRLDDFVCATFSPVHTWPNKNLRWNEITFSIWPLLIFLLNAVEQHAGNNVVKVFFSKVGVTLSGVD